jgi:hypothetical protein
MLALAQGSNQLFSNILIYIPKSVHGLAMCREHFALLLPVLLLTTDVLDFQTCRHHREMTSKSSPDCFRELQQDEGILTRGKRVDDRYLGK